MERTNKATDQQMIDEAAYRMRTLGLSEIYIEDFINSFPHVFITPSGEEHLMDGDEDNIRDYYERPYNGYTWTMIIKEAEPRCGGEPDWFDYYILFVSDDPDNWEIERKELFAMEPTMYLVSYPNRLDGEDEMIQEFVKKKIRLTEQGSLVLE